MKYAEHLSGHPEPRDRRDPQLSLLVDMNRPSEVLREIGTIFRMIRAGGDFAPVETAFRDIVALFEGRFPGYQACSTRYHNLKHTTDTALAMARLMHGAHAGGRPLDGRSASLGLAAALFHDAGYIPDTTDRVGSGAKLAAVHIQRSIAFMTDYLAARGVSRRDLRMAETAVHCTDLNLPVEEVRFDGDAGELIAKMLAASDLLAQTADRNYLEKLPLLFEEFKAAGGPDYENALSLILDATQFNRKMSRRLEHELGGVDGYMAGHFEARWNIHRDLYRDSIDNAMTYLSHFPRQAEGDYTIHLRRKHGL